MAAYYNEIDPFAAAWLRELISAGHIAPGEVDERSIEDVYPNDLRGFTQCHFFAGIGVWSHALRSAGWPDDRPVWTASCPCQPFSAAGKGGGFTDERHLWPALFHLLRQLRPVVVFGEQVASKDGLAWLDLVHDDLEGTGYTVGAIDSCAAGFGAPHLRQRLYWMANAEGVRLEGVQGSREGWTKPYEPIAISGLGDATHQPRERRTGRIFRTKTQECGEGVAVDGNLPVGFEHAGESVGMFTSRPTNGQWGAADWLFCRDGKWRAVEPGTFPLAHGATNRVGRLRGYGNAIVAPQATEIIRTYLNGY